MHCPAALWLLQRGIIHELVAENVLFARSLVNFFPLFAGAQVHKGVQAHEIVETKAAEGLVWLHAPECVLAVGADGNDLTLAFDGIDNVAQSVLLCKAIARGESLSIE